MRESSVSDTGRVIIIINSILPYAYEVNNILGLPKGFTYRFRFRTYWMPELKSSLQLIGREGLVILRNFDTARFVPLRRMHIYNVFEVGKFSYIEYVLEDIVELDSDEAAREQQLNDFNERMQPAIRNFANEPGENLQKLIFMYSDVAYGIRDKNYDGTEKNKELNTWGNLIEVLGHIKCFQDFDFLKFFQIVDNEGRVVAIESSQTNSTSYKIRFSLRPDVVYRAQIVQRMFTEQVGDSSVIEARQIQITGEPGEIQEIRSLHNITGRYDLYQFSFKTYPTYRTKSSSLYLEVRREEALPVIELPINILVSGMQRTISILSLLALIFGIGIIMLIGQIQYLSEPDRELIQRLGIIIAIISSYVRPSLRPLSNMISAEKSI